MEFILMNETEARPSIVQQGRKAAEIGIADLRPYRHLLRISSSILPTTKFRWTFLPATFHVFFDPTRWYFAVAAVAAFALVSCVFIICPLQLRLFRRILFIHDDSGLSLAKFLH